MRLKKIEAYTEVVNEKKSYTRNIYIKDGHLLIMIKTKGDVDTEQIIGTDYWNETELPSSVRKALNKQAKSGELKI